jgi:hypothetical protein
MILINLCGGPGSGKTTASFYLAYRIKMAGYRFELVGEAAREHHIYDSVPGFCAPPLLDNQVLLAGQQYERILRLKRHKFQVAVSDSPLVQGLLYCKDHHYASNLLRVIRDVENDFETYNIFIHPRPGSYDPESRVQRTEKEARALDREVCALVGPFWLEVKWGQEKKMANRVLKLLAEKFPQKMKRPNSVKLGAS